jgi:hypothetical protein
MWRTTPLHLPADAGAHHLESAAGLLTGVLERVSPLTVCTTPYLPAVRDAVKGMRLMAALFREHPADGADQDLAFLLPLRAAGMVLQLLGAQSSAAPDRAELRAEQALLEGEFSDWLQSAQAALRPEPIPLSQAVGYQLDTVLGAAGLLGR